MALQDRRILDPAPGVQESRAPDLKRLPIVSIIVIVASTATLLWSYYVTGGQRWFPPEWYISPGTVREEWWRVFTSLISHGNPIHIFFNMSVVVTLGIPLERSIASWRFLLVSLITGIGSAVFVILFSPEAPTVGASGMILGYAGAMLPIVTRQARREMTMWLVQVAIISLLPFVSWQGHLGGFLFGLPCGLLLRNGAKNFAVAAPALLLAAVGAMLLAISRAPVAP